MENTYIINTHSHANMLRETNIDKAIKNAQDEKIITIVPSSTAEDIFEVNEFIQKYNDVYGYVGVFPEEVKTFTDKTLSDMENIIRSCPASAGPCSKIPILSLILSLPPQHPDLLPHNDIRPRFVDTDRNTYYAFIRQALCLCPVQLRLINPPDRFLLFSCKRDNRVHKYQKHQNRRYDAADPA